MSHIDFEKKILRLKNRPKVTFSPKSLWAFTALKHKALKEGHQRNGILVPYFKEA